MKKFLQAAFLFIFLSVSSFAQKEGNIWYFGDQAGIDFNSGAPVPVNNGQQLSTLEGCATICDKNTGQLLFYTDGTYVWDKNNNLMPNGSGLYGAYSATQSAVVVPMPGSSTIYYIFTVDAQAGEVVGPAVSWSGYGGAAYSIVDMTQNGGLGDVTTKNVILLTPTCEKIAAVRHCNGQDMWIVIHGWNSNTFNVYLLTSSGLTLQNTISIGDNQYDAGSGYAFETLGYMKFSPNGGKLVMVTYPYINEVQIFDFDNSTGVISNPNIDNNFVFYYDIFGDLYNGLYGATFSPDNSRLYIGETGYSGDFEEPSKVYQYDMTQGSNAAILSSRVVVHTTNAYSIGALQIGPDGKIYIAKESQSTGEFNRLDVINNPNGLGAACNYVNNGLNITASGGLSEFGLPDIVETFLVPAYTASLIYPGCIGNDTLAFTDSINGTITTNWNFGDPSSGASNTSTLQNPSHTFSSNGSYTITVQIANKCKTDTYSQTISVGTSPSASINPPSASTCNGAPATLTASGGGTYSWSPGGATTSSVSVNPGSPTLYTVTVTTSGCTATASTTVNVTTVNASASPPVSVCNGQSATLTASPAGDTYSWNPGGATTSSITVIPGGNITFSVTVTGAGGCSSTASTSVTVNSNPPTPVITASISGDTLYCSTDPSYISYQWYRNDTIMPGRTSDSLIIGQDSASFSVIVTDGNTCINKAVFAARALPIELLSFDAAYNGKTVDLIWSTASEINNDFFTVERTKDGFDFTSIINVKGAGNSSHLLNYHAVDEHPLFGVSAYRLKQTDFDGKYAYSKMVAVSIHSGSIAITTLNPISDQGLINYLIFSPSGKSFNIAITDLIGKTLVEKTTSENYGTIDFSGFAHGIYLFKAFDSNGISVKRFVY